MTGSTGTVVGEQRYYPFGETRLTTGTMFTDKLYTGQREMAGLGIYHYGARFYSPKLGRFLSPDTIVPGTADPQAYNRYSYVLNSPLNYVDPSGHKPCWATKKYSCDLSKMTKAKADKEVAKYKPADQQAVINFFQNQGVPVSKKGGGNAGGGGGATVTPSSRPDYHQFMVPIDGPSTGCTYSTCFTTLPGLSSEAGGENHFSKESCAKCIILGAAIVLAMVPTELLLGAGLVFGFVEPTPIVEAVLLPFEALALNVTLIGIQFMAQGQNRSFEEVNIDPLPLIHPFFPDFMPDDVSTPWYER